MLEEYREFHHGVLYPVKGARGAEMRGKRMMR